MAGLKPVAAVLKDLAAWDSDLLPSLERDFISLSRLVETRGLPILMIDLPEAGKVYDQALSSGIFIWSNLPKTFGSLGSKKGILFEQLFLRTFDEDGVLRKNPDVNHIYFTRQILYLAKKVRYDCPEQAVAAEVEVFKKIDEGLRTPTLEWDCDDFDIDKVLHISFLDGYRSFPDMFSHRDACPKPLLGYLEDVCDRLMSLLPAINLKEIEPRHGPGSVADAGRGEDKYLFPTWPRKLDRTFPFEYFAQHREDLHLEQQLSHSLNEPPARLLAVPKTLKGPRLIASEPVSHQWLQGGLMRWIRKNLPFPLRLCIDFRSQEPSRKSALLASLEGTSATVDLSSASDRLSCWVIERVFRKHPDFLLALHAARTRWLVNSTGVGEPFFIKLKKFAAQGAATTFPVQSIVYACVAIAAILYENGGAVSNRSIRNAARRTRVFGDDIILPSYAVQSLTLLLTHLELKVNMGKTHTKGHFRESCGMDAYLGNVVTPVYIRDLELGATAESLVSWVDVSNNAYRAGLWNLATWMIEQIPPAKRRLIPITNQNLGCITLLTYFPCLISLRERTCKSLHRKEVLALQAVDKEDRKQRDSYQSLLQYFTEKPRQETNWSSGWTVRNRLQLRRRWVPTYL